jgi:hypothetical protein
MVTETEDLYALLQVTPAASQADIEAAYTRLNDLYRPDRLADGPPEFQELAARRRQELQTAYTVLSDTAQRTAYDQLRAGPPASVDLDFRPLPPAARRERPSPSIPVPPVIPAMAGLAATGERTAPRRGRRSILTPLLIGVGALGILLLLVLSSVRVQSGVTAMATPALPNVTLPYTPEQVRDAEARTQNSKDPQAWVNYGNVLYDNLETMREQSPLSPQYLGSVPQWVGVTDAYSQALRLGAGADVRADLAISLFYYGIGANQKAAVTQALAESEQAQKSSPDDPRVLLNRGLILVGLNPPRLNDALTVWRHLVSVAPESREAQRAQELIASYGS